MPIDRLYRTHQLAVVLGVPGALVLVTPLRAEEINSTRDIQPIPQEHRWGCRGEKKQESGLRLDQRGSMLRGGDYDQPTQLKNVRTRSPSPNP